MSRVFWIAVGAVGGIVAYRKGTEAAARARELGPLGTAQVVTRATGRAAIGAAHGLGRLRDYQARRQGTLIIGSAQDVTAVPGEDLPGDWVPAPTAVPPRPRSTGRPPHAGASARTRSRTAPRHAPAPTATGHQTGPAGTGTGTGGAGVGPAGPTRTGPGVSTGPAAPHPAPGPGPVVDQPEDADPATPGDGDR